MSWYQKNKERAREYAHKRNLRTRERNAEYQRIRKQERLEYRIGVTPWIPVKVKRELINRTGGKCERRDSKCNGLLCIHHIDRNPKNNALSNLMVLCQAHHVLEHELFMKGLEARGYKIE